MSSLLSAPSTMIAVVEDEEHLAQGLLFNLEAEGFLVHHEVDGEAALRWLLSPQNRPTAIVLDVMLPGRDGFSIVRALRDAGRFTPVLLLTARGRAEDIVEGFSAGADDYLPKPFDLNILLARLHALLRRTSWQQSPPSQDVLPAEPVHTEPGDQTRVGGKLIDFGNLEIRSVSPETSGAPVRLTVMEADLLRYLLSRPGRVVSRKEILEEVWHVHSGTDTRPIDNFIVRLRRHLEPDPAAPRYLLTVRGVGYRYAPPDGA